jgi:hypothetical protein
MICVDDGHFSVEIPANKVLPILLTLSSESSKDKLVAVVIDEMITRYYINPSITAIAKAANEMGGYTRANMVRAAENNVRTPGVNKTTTGCVVIRPQYGGWH